MNMCPRKSVHADRLALLLLVLLWAAPAHAYIDAGTGSMLLQVLIGGLFACVIGVRMFWREIKRRLARMFGRQSRGALDDIENEAEAPGGDLADGGGRE